MDIISGSKYHIQKTRQYPQCKEYRDHKETASSLPFRRPHILTCRTDNIMGAKFAHALYRTNDPLWLKNSRPGYPRYFFSRVARYCASGFRWYWFLSQFQIIRRSTAMGTRSSMGRNRLPAIWASRKSHKRTYPQKLLFRRLGASSGKPVANMLKGKRAFCGMQEGTVWYLFYLACLH